MTQYLSFIEIKAFGSFKVSSYSGSDSSSICLHSILL
jgi:hypothetical protein